MKIVKVPRVNGLGFCGSVGVGDLIVRKIQKTEDGKLRIEKIDVGNEDVDKDEKLIYEKAREIFSGGGRVVFLGGDHSISFPLIRAFNGVFDNAFLIVFDAHADCDFVSGNATNEEWLRALIESGFNSANVILIGARRIWENERRFLVERGVKVFSDVYDFEAVGDYVTERANGKDVYVSIDVDVLEPAFAPGVSYPEPNGLSSKEFFYLLKRVFCIKSLRAIDVVEVDVEKDGRFDFRTVGIGVKILEEFLDSFK